jgi:stearoyl-CoA desaturase (delta-9 desaturase)
VSATPIEGPTAADCEPVARPHLDTVLTTVVTVVPLLGLAAAGWQMWGGTLHWHDLVVLAVTYALTGFGISVGYHRLFTHRAFKSTAVVRGVFGALGSAALEGPVISWVANHRKHHTFADLEGDPHSPHVDHGGGVLGTLRGLGHAHMGWLFSHTQRGAKKRFAADLLKDPVARFIDRTWVLWVAAGLALPFGLGVALSGTIAGGLTGLLWGGAVRIVLLHHATYSINSLCHLFGRRRFATGDESRNLAWLAPLSFGEAWHNNHHAFPRSAAHGLRPSEFDPSEWVIRGLARVGLAWDLVEVPLASRRAKAI